MGQAKKRGTYEERREQSIARRKAELQAAHEKWLEDEAERKRKAQEAWDALTDEEKAEVKTRAARNHRGRLPIGAMAILPLLMLAGCSGGMMPNIRARR